MKVLVIILLFISTSSAQIITPDQNRCYTLSRLNALKGLSPIKNGMFACCSDCAPGTIPCTASSTGSFAMLQAGAWNCPDVAAGVLCTPPGCVDFFDDFLVSSYKNVTNGMTNPFGFILSANAGNCTVDTGTPVGGDYNDEIEFAVQPQTVTDTCGIEIGSNDGTGFFGTTFLATALRDNPGTFFETRIKWVAGTLGSSSSDYFIMVGFGSFGTGGSPSFCVINSACIYLISQPSGTFAGRWTLASRDASGGTTETDCGVGPALGVQQKLRITSIPGPGWTATVNGTVCPSVTTHVGLYGTDILSARVKFQGVLNTQLKKMDTDYVWVRQMTGR